MEEDLQEIMQKHYPKNEPGGALLVVQEDSVVLREGFGMANLEEQESIDPSTNFRMASVSKQFTAMTLLSLQQETGLQVIDSIGAYLDSLPDFAKEITVEQLMTHSSGISDYEPMIPESQQHQISDAEVLALVGQSDSLYFPAGIDFRYSNTAFCVLTQIVEAKTGLGYRDYIREHLFEELDMNHSMVYDENKEIVNRAFGYHRKNDDWKFADQSLTSATMGDGSVYTSLNDYEKWIRFLWENPFSNDHDNPLLPHQNIDANFDYGYGWFVGTEEDGSRAFFHSGETTGFHNIVYHNPSKKTAIVLFTNADDQRIGKAFQEVAHALDIRINGVSNSQNLFEVLSAIYGD